MLVFVIFYDRRVFFISVLPGIRRIGGDRFGVIGSILLKMTADIIDRRCNIVPGRTVGIVNIHNLRLLAL